MTPDGSGTTLRIQANEKWSASPASALSVVMLGFRRADLLERAIASFVRHNSVSDWELILVLNGAGEEVRRYAEELLRRAEFPLLIIPTASCRPGAARNLGVARARAPVLFFLDDDVECFQDIAGAALRIFRDQRVAAAGGANLTPPESGPLERAAGYVFASRLGTAGMRARYLPLPEGPADEHSLILCNLAVRRSAFFAEQGFARHLISNEENVLLQQLERQGTGLWRSPELAVFHRRRADWRGTFEQAAKYGGGRAQNLLLLPHTLRALYFLPALLLLYFMLLPVFWAWISGWALIPLAIYAALVLGHTLYFARRDAAGWFALGLFPCIHLAYGFGFLRALGRWSWCRKKLLEHAV